MNFLVTTLERFRRSWTADGAPDCAAMDESGHDAAVLDVIGSKHPQRIVVSLTQSAISDISQARQLGAQLIHLLDTDRPASLWVDLGQIGQVSSECLNQLISVNCHARSIGIQLVLGNLCQPLREVFRITRLDRLFELDNER